ncbi:MAG: hypothetical protein V3R66_02640 [Rhodospirillales bacterium]
MRFLLAAVAMEIMLMACSISGESIIETPIPAQPQPGPCSNGDREWDYQQSEILRLNKGYAYFEIARRAEFVEQFNAIPPKTDRSVPDLAGYFAKPGGNVAILAFADGGCVTYLEVVNFDKLQGILLRLGN